MIELSDAYAVTKRMNSKYIINIVFVGEEYSWE